MPNRDIFKNLDFPFAYFKSVDIQILFTNSFIYKNYSDLIQIFTVSREFELIELDKFYKEMFRDNAELLDFYKTNVKFSLSVKFI